MKAKHTQFETGVQVGLSKSSNRSHVALQLIQM